MNLSEPIRTLLRDHDCVIIPDFGGLIAEYAPAQIHPVRHTLAPPTKRVAFNQALTRNDGLLVDAISRAANLPLAQAREQVRVAVQRMQEELANNRRVELVGIGFMRRALGQGIEFEYTGTQNLLAASYGLPELVSRPVRATDALLARERQVAVPMLAAGRNRRAKVLKVTAGIMAVLLALAANYLFALRQGFLSDDFSAGTSQQQAVRVQPAPVATKKVVARQQAALANNGWDDAAATPTPVPSLPVETTTAPVAAAASSAVIAAEPVKKAEKPATPILTKQTAPKATKLAKAKTPPPGWEKAEVSTVKDDASSTIKSKTGRYYIIAGSYTSLKGAEKGRQALVRLGKPARVILPQPGSRQYKLSVADFADRTSADRQAEILRKRLGSIWILNY